MILVKTLICRVRLNYSPHAEKAPSQGDRRSPSVAFAIPTFAAAQVAAPLSASNAEELENAKGGRSPVQRADSAMVADLVYDLMKRELKLARERQRPI
jgi:hypothetical protein